MHTAQRASAMVIGDVALDKADGKPAGGKLFCAEAAGKEAALVLVPLKIYDEDATKSGFRKLHLMISSSGMATTKRPPQRRISRICAMISSRKFHGKINTKSGFVSKITGGFRIGMREPGSR